MPARNTTVSYHPSALQRYITYVVGHPWLVLLCVTAVTLSLARGLTALRLEVDPDEQLPQQHPYIQALNRIHQTFGDKNLVIIGLRPLTGDIFTAPFLSNLRRATDAVAAIPGANPQLIQSIASPSVRTISTRNGQFFVTPVMPALETEEEDAGRVKQHLLADPTLVGTLVSEDHSAAAIYATFELSPALPGYVNLHRAVVEALHRVNDGTFTVYLSGPVVIASSLTSHAADMGRFFIIAVFIIGIIHYEAFRTWQAVILPLITGLLSVAWSLGIIGLLGIAIDPYNATTPVLILAVAAGHAVQILKRYYEELARLGDSQAAIVASMTRVGMVMVAAGAIASLSFFSLATLGTESMRTFGLFTGLGILATLTNEMTTIPALRALLPSTGAHTQAGRNLHPRLDRALDCLAHTLSSRTNARRVLLAYSVAMLAASALATTISVDTTLKKNFGRNDSVRADDDWLNRRFAGTNVLLFLVEGPEEGAIASPSALRGIDDFERKLEALPGVGRALSVVDTIKQIHQAMRPTSDTTRLPNKQNLATQYLFLYTLSGGNDLATRLTADNRIAKVVAMLQHDSTRYGEALIRRAREIAATELPPGYTLSVAGTVASNAALTATMVRGKILNIVQVTVIMIVISSVVLRSLLAALIVAAPLGAAVMINFATMGLLGISLDVSTAVITAMAVGIGADYAIYFIFRVREEYWAADESLPTALSRAMQTSGKGILYVSSAVAFGYAALCLSGFRIFVQLGSLVGLAMLSSSLSTLLIVPSLLTVLSGSTLIVRVLGRRIPVEHVCK